MRFTPFLRCCGWLAALCPLGFAGIVFYLQNRQPAYDWQTQFMSELALGAQGAMMTGAFGLLATGAVSLIPCLRSPCRDAAWVQWLLSGLLGAAAVAFAVAGAVTLERAVTVHVASVGVAFVAVATAAFIVFRHRGFGWLRWFSLAALLLALTALGLGNGGWLEPGAAQRLTALGILGWMSGAGMYGAFRNS
jgi:hypothetical protein